MATSSTLISFQPTRRKEEVSRKAAKGQRKKAVNEKRLSMRLVQWLPLNLGGPGDHGTYLTYAACRHFNLANARLRKQTITMSQTSIRTNPETVKDCFALYLKYNGERSDLIEEEMQRLGWTSFKKSVLFDRRGKNEANHRDGWITKFGWANALKLHLATAATAAETSAESLLMENESIRKAAFIEIQAQGVRASKEIVYQHNIYTQNCIKILEKLEAARDNYANFVYFLQQLLKAAALISPDLAKEICDAEEALLDWAEREFVTDDERPED